MAQSTLLRSANTSATCSPSTCPAHNALRLRAQARVAAAAVVTSSAPQRAPFAMHPFGPIGSSSRARTMLHPVRSIESSGTVPPLQALNEGTLGFGFSGGGLLFAYYVGIIMVLRDELGVLTDSTPVAGASAGSLIAALSKSGATETELLESTFALAHDCRTNGTTFRLKSVLQRTLDELMPEDIHERCSGKVFVAVTKVWPRLKPQLVSQFSSKQQLIDTLMVSCHVPWYFDGNWTTGYQASAAFDGGALNFIPVPPNCPGAVKVACFPSQQLKLFKGIGLSPDHFEDWPYGTRQMVSWAFQPASDEMLMFLFHKGKKHARAWAEHHGIEPVKQLVTAAVAGSGIYLPNQLKRLRRKMYDDGQHK